MKINVWCASQILLHLSAGGMWVWLSLVQAVPQWLATALILNACVGLVAAVWRWASESNETVSG